MDQKKEKSIKKEYLKYSNINPKEYDTLNTLYVDNANELLKDSEYYAYKLKKKHNHSYYRYHYILFISVITLLIYTLLSLIGGNVGGDYFFHTLYYRLFVSPYYLTINVITSVLFLLYTLITIKKRGILDIGISCLNVILVIVSNIILFYGLESTITTSNISYIFPCLFSATNATSGELVALVIDIYPIYMLVIFLYSIIRILVNQLMKSNEDKYYFLTYYGKREIIKGYESYYKSVKNLTKDEIKDTNIDILVAEIVRNRSSIFIKSKKYNFMLAYAIYYFVTTLVLQATLFIFSINNESLGLIVSNYYVMLELTFLLSYVGFLIYAAVSYRKRHFYDWIVLGVTICVTAIFYFLISTYSSVFNGEVLFYNLFQIYFGADLIPYYDPTIFIAIILLVVAIIFKVYDTHKKINLAYTNM